MKTLRFIALFFCLASLASLAVCIFTDWNDGLLLPLALCLSLAGNVLNILANRQDKSRKEMEK